jgi:glycerol-1-phosphate dehydrogenase [NAD(P)+]
MSFVATSQFQERAMTTSPARTAEAPAGGWTALIDDIVAGRWTNPETGELAKVPFDRIVFAESLDGAEADLAASVRLDTGIAVVCDATTYDVLGQRVARALGRFGVVDTVVLDHPHADMAAVASLKSRLSSAQSVVAVGSGTINDLCKYVTGLDGRRYCVFGTAASMNGYTSSTASITLKSGLKVSLPSHAPSGVFFDLAINAAAPTRLTAAGFGDCLVRSVAQVDWWMSYRLLGTPYHRSPYIIQAGDEPRLNSQAAELKAGGVTAVGYLQRVLTLCGLGVSFTGVTNHGSMGEHQISHYIDCFAGARHPGTLHGQQVGVATLTMARLQQQMLSSDKPPVLKPTIVDEAGMRRRMGDAVAADCLKLFRKKALDGAGAKALNAKLEGLWPQLRNELAGFTIPAAELTRLLRVSGGPATAKELGVPVDFYREAVVCAREMRDRFSFLDLAADAGLLVDFAAGEH